MPRIALLEEAVINKIAAGEVVERPSLVVKELVENAIDAGADIITIEIKDGGFQLIRVTDNGYGIEAEEVRNAFLRHATSKIRYAEDLQTVESLGFRGEALSSIAAVSQTEVITKTKEKLMGVRYVIEGGREQRMEAIGCPEGTTFLVRNLFFNTPARRKFMKTPQTEAGYIGDMIQYLALSHENICFKYIHNGQLKLQTSGNGNRKEAIYSIFGRDIAGNLCLVEEVQAIKDGFLHITGFCGKPVITRGNRNLEIYFVNGRYIKNNVITEAIEDAYRPYMMTRKYPFTALYLELPLYLVDINVHPSKLEAQFGNREVIYQLVEHAISHALSKKELIPEVFVEKKHSLEVFQEQKLIEEKQDIGILSEKDSFSDRSFFDGVPFIKEESETVALKPYQEELFEMPFLCKEAKKQHKIIGQLFSTYWLIEFHDKLFILDQHAAHEKVLYERNLAAFYKKEKLYSQLLIVPVIVSLSMTEQQILKENLSFLQKFGFEIEPFGGNEYAIHAVPADMMDLADQELFLEFLQALIKGQKTPEFILEKMAMISCKGAVKGKKELKKEEVIALLDELLTLKQPYHCPHGRPTIISISKYEIEKKFKRIV